MKKHLLIVLMLIVAVLAFSSCGHEHEWSEWTTTTEVTCTTDGEQKRTCECGEVETKVVVAKGHTAGDAATCTTTQNCKDCNAVLASALGHKPGAEATCTTAQICAVCKDELKAALGHKPGAAATCTTSQTCTVCKDELKAALGHKPGAEATCTSAQTCTVCKTELVAALGHKPGDAATCTTAQTCTVCKAELAAALGHKPGAEATCTTAQTCTVCNTELVAAGHNWRAATCESPKTCSRCQATEGEALGHKKGSDGYCTACGKKVTIDMNTVLGNPNECKTTSYFGFCYYKNTADGIKLCWGAENLSGKTINYYTVTIYFYNSVGDPAYSEITGKSSKTIKYVGPVAPGNDLIIYGIVDYVPVCSKVLIGEVTVEYSDGTSDSGWYGWYTTYKNSSIK